MLTDSQIDSSQYANLNRVIAWFITLRWVACGGVVVTLLGALFGFRYPLPYLPLFLVTALLCLSNLLFSLYFIVWKRRNLSRKEMSGLFHAQICGDYLLLFLLVYFSGFLDNPFSYFFVFHIMLTSFIFASRVVFRYLAALLVFLAAATVAEYFHWIPHFPLLPSREDAYTRLLLPGAVGLGSTLAISGYLVTQIKKRIEEKGKRVEVELDRYKNLDRAKSNFILQVTHELRGPVAAVKGFHEMILRGITGGIEPKTAGAIKKADRRIDNLLTIIDEMIDFAYMKSEEEVRHGKTERNLREIIDYNLRALRAPAREKSITLETNCPEGLVLETNMDLMNIILGNLINNAIKYSPPETLISVDAVGDSSEIHLQVKDQGYGIKPDELDKVFEEFYRTRRARELLKDGTGLGLPLVKRAVESLGGRMSLHSEIDRGTTFHIFFPQGKRQGGTNEKDPDHR